MFELKCAVLKDSIVSGDFKTATKILHLAFDRQQKAKLIYEAKQIIEIGKGGNK